MEFPLILIMIILALFVFHYGINYCTKYSRGSSTSNLNYTTMFKKNTDLYNSMSSKEKSDVCNDTQIYTYDSHVEGPTVLIVSGTHGNEPAGSVACFKLMNKLDKGEIKLVKGKIVVIPVINVCGILNYRREDDLNRDLNRQYPNEESASEASLPKITQKVIEAVKNADWVLDGHEAWGYYKLNGTLIQPGDSMGNTLTTGHTQESHEFALKCIYELNKTITTDYKKFLTYPDKPLKGTLREYCNMLGKHYILTESGAGQNEVEPINVRRDQHYTVFVTVLTQLEVIE